VLTIASACALSATALPIAAQAASASHGRPVARMAIAAPATSTVSGPINFGARHVGRGVRKVVFSIDGSHRWTALRSPYRYHRTGVLNTRKLRNGSHTLTVKAIFAHRRVRVAHHRIVVRNAPTPTRTVKLPAGPLNVGVSSPPAGGVAGPSVALFNRETYQYSSALSPAAEANRYQVMVLQYNDAPFAAALKAANPNLKLLLYQNIMYSRPTDPAGWATCTSYQSDQANHPTWFVKDQNGNPIGSKSYAGNVYMDVGNAGYEQACMAHATAMAKQAGFDGLFLDDVTAIPHNEMAAGVTMAQYPTPGAWNSAMSSMVTAAAAQAHAQGLLVVGNIGGATTANGVWQQWNSQLDGAEEESWGGSGSPAQQLYSWHTKLAEAQWSAANGKIALLHSYASSEAGNTFDIASMLLTADGKASYSTSNANLTNSEGWYPEYDTAQRLGAPAGPYKQLANGVYQRAFAHGIILVNATAQAIGRFSLGGGSYSGSGLAGATSTQMAAQSAQILLAG
jgi:hypothetical protein